MSNWHTQCLWKGFIHIFLTLGSLLAFSKLKNCLQFQSNTEFIERKSSLADTYDWNKFLLQWTIDNEWNNGVMWSKEKCDEFFLFTFISLQCLIAMIFLNRVISILYFFHILLWRTHYLLVYYCQPLKH